ncbi:hypothetical protein L9F63_000022, partial [Diploptera punctata]
ERGKTKTDNRVVSHCIACNSPCSPSSLAFILLICGLYLPLYLHLTLRQMVDSSQNKKEITTIQICKRKMEQKIS